MRGIRPAYLLVFLALILAIVSPIVIRWASAPDGPAIVIADPAGDERTIDLEEIERLPRLCRRGSYENQFGNWRDEGEYCGALLVDLLGVDVDYTSIVVVAEDGYRVEIERWRIEDSEQPIVLAFSFDGRTVPDWSDGYRIAVLPTDGGVSNADYGAESAGSYWVKNVSRIILRSD